MSQLALSQATVGSCCYILGAGFSCGAGIPLSNDFLDKMKAVRPQYYLGKTLPPLNVPMENLFRFRSERLKLFDDSLKNNVEFWLSLVSAGTLGSITSRGFTKYHMQIAIAQVIEYYVRSATNYEYIDKFVFYANKSKNNAIVTLNYDDLVEQSCERSMVPYRHGFKKGGYNGYFDLDISSFNKEMFDIDENHATIPILKLHGSYNWIAKNYETLKLVGDMHNFFFSNQVFWENEWMQYSFVIEPPTIDKMYAGHILSAIWARTYDSLASASHIIVIGYSFPENDGYVKHLIMASLADNDSLKEATIVDPCCDDSYKSRIKWLLDLLKAKKVSITFCQQTAKDWIENQMTGFTTS